MSEADRARQARVHAMLMAGQSLQGGASFVPDPSLAAPAVGADGGAALVASRSHSSSTSSRTPPSRRSGSPSHSSQRSQSRKQRERDEAAAVAAAAHAEIDLRFQKEEVLPTPSLADRPLASSTLAQQLQLARSGLDDSNFPRPSSGLATHRFTVYLPHEEGSMVQIAVHGDSCSAHGLVKAALECARVEHGGELPPGLLDDPWSYRVHVGDEDEPGEIDSDYPALDVRSDVVALGVETLVLRDRVEARLSAPSNAGVAGAHAARPSIVEGPGASHSSASNSRTGKGFANLETEEPKKKQSEQAKCCVVQ